MLSSIFKKKNNTNQVPVYIGHKPSTYHWFVYYAGFSFELFKDGKGVLLFDCKEVKDSRLNNCEFTKVGTTSDSLVVVYKKYQEQQQRPKTYQTIINDCQLFAVDLANEITGNNKIRMEVSVKQASSAKEDVVESLGQYDIVFPETTLGSRKSFANWLDWLKDQQTAEIPQTPNSTSFTATLNNVTLKDTSGKPVYVVKNDQVEEMKLNMLTNWLVDYDKEIKEEFGMHLNELLWNEKLVFTLEGTGQTINFDPTTITPEFRRFLEVVVDCLFHKLINAHEDWDRDLLLGQILQGDIIKLLFIYCYFLNAEEADH